jgi:hypothetical protein
VSDSVSLGNRAARAARDLKYKAAALGPITRQLLVSLTATNAHAQFAAGAAINATSGFTDVPANTCTRVPQLTVGASHVETVYTLTGVDIDTGAVLTEVLTVAAGAGTTKFTKPFGRAITLLTSDVDPQDTVDLEWGDAWVSPTCREIICGTGGIVECELDDDPAGNQIQVTLPTGPMVRAIRRIYLDNTAAADITLGW